MIAACSLSQRVVSKPVRWVCRPLLWRVSMASSAVVQRLEQRAQMADELIVKLKQQVGELKQCAGEARQLTAENAQLTQEVDRLKKKLIQLEIRNGINQVPLPTSIAKASVTNEQPPAPAPKNNAPAPAENAKPAETNANKENKKEKKEGGNKKEKKEGKKKQQQPAAAVPLDVTALDLRIGRIVDVKKHPDADSLYVEQVDCGEEMPRTVVSGLVKHIPIEQMQDKVVILCCNMKPAKMRGILSQAMVMCASSPEKVELINPPAGAVPGDRVSFNGYQMSESFPPQMNPKKKIFESISPDLRTSDKGVATYKGVPFEIQGKGICKSPTMTNSLIK
ncbi:aminoacyl tRNA synthase complex-interacting multifunctional protein 1-like [Amphiura filiformis]|uniref:aminoacyl tRNA synthase complex-interacting multifunctional protein 1-like n=1 Tax=Amphiura filiformis TaxID=82378 RepID=UPI003B21A9D5